MFSVPERLEAQRPGLSRLASRAFGHAVSVRA